MTGEKCIKALPVKVLLVQVPDFRIDLKKSNIKRHHGRNRSKETTQFKIGDRAERRKSPTMLISLLLNRKRAQEESFRAN